MIHARSHALPLCLAALLALQLGGCTRKAEPAAPVAKAFGTAIVEVSGSKQVSGVGMALDQPVIVQVNDAQGNAVAGAPVWLHAPMGASVGPPSGITGTDGQFTASVTLGGMSGRYQIAASTRDSAGKVIELKMEEIALGYQQQLGRQLSDLYCSRCHDSESTAERVSNHDNLQAKPHAFNDGAALNGMSDEDLVSIISHGGPALNRSAEMPPYAYFLNKADIQAILAYIRAVSDPPYRAKGLVYATN